MTDGIPPTEMPWELAAVLPDRLCTRYIAIKIFERNAA